MAHEGAMNTSNVFVFLPDTLNCNDFGMLEGFSRNDGDIISFFVTNDKLQTISPNSIGYVSEISPSKAQSIMERDSEWIHININTQKIFVNSRSAETNITCIRYNYSLFHKSEMLQGCSDEYGSHFCTLIEAIQRGNIKSGITNKRLNFIPVIVYLMNLFLYTFVKFVNIVRPIVSYSAILTQLQDSAIVTRWLVDSLQQEERFTIKTRSVIISKFCDFLFGMMVLFYALKYEKEITENVKLWGTGIIETIKQLLAILMGSPVGLKLNYAFSQNLGKFFLYHISLWEAFLNACQLLLNYSFKLLVIPGSLGLTYQTALFSDLITFATFHVYCIYVYAARLYGLQVHILVSLSKLFIGRKYNPLRERVDSLQYTYNQLFIGTLGFTILLFLLPTTLLYYSVFTALRLILIVFDGFFSRLRYILQCLPFYVFTLWLVRSSKIAGKINLEIVESSSQFTIYAKLKVNPLWASVKYSIPDVLSKPNDVPWGATISAVFLGRLL